MIHLKSLTPETYTALERVCGNYEWPDLHPWEQPELVAWLSFKLKFIADSDDAFPRGKWATIQRLQAMLEEHAEREVKGDNERFSARPA